MSYDLMVFDPAAAPRERNEFMAWFKQQAEWSEGHSYDDPANASPPLQKWFAEIAEKFPPMNGPFAKDEDIDNPKCTDHCIGKNIIYSAFSWSSAEEAFEVVRSLAIRHEIGFFDVSSDSGEIYYPNSRGPKNKPWWKLW